MADLAYINPDILSWAQERAGMSADELSYAAGIKTEKLLLWLNAREKPTFVQAQKLASRLFIPFAYLFLPYPPDESLPLPDLRTISDRGVQGKISVNLRDTVFTVLRRQEWYKEYLKDQDAQVLSFISSVSMSSSPDTVARVIKDFLFPDGIEPAGMKWEEYQRRIIHAAEQAGILVMRSGIVDSNTHRPLSVKEFRGFAISDVMAPVIFINLADAPAARLFTLIHELAHLWIGVSGISSAGVNDEHDTEKFCNQVAGDFLMPAEETIARWDNQNTIGENVASLARYFHVSRYVVIRRACDLGLVVYNDYLSYYHELLQEFKARESGGGNYYAVAQNKNSQRFSKAILDEALSGRVLFRDAGRLLGVAPGKLKRFAQEAGA